MAEDMPQTPPQGRLAGPGRMLKSVLVLSLALNFAVAGLFIGSLIKGRSDGPRPQAVRDLGFGLFAPALTEEDRRALRRDFAERAPDMRAARRAMRQDLAELLDAIRAEPFDAPRLTQVLERSRLRASERRDLGEELILAHLARLDPAERAAFADRLEQGLRRRGPGRPEGRDPDKDHRSSAP